MDKFSLEDLMKEGTGSIVDVRTPGEFMGGHVHGSNNIPLDEIPQRMEEVQALETPLILCCASGTRSGHAATYLGQMGIECVNGGSWLDVNYYQNQTV